MKPSPLSPVNRRWLLERARASLVATLGGTELPQAEPPGPLAEPLGCFVSLHSRTGRLRGCIGTFIADLPLWQQVEEMAVAAATRDPRFSPLLLAELPEVVIEISVLSARRPADPEEVHVGEHGLWIEREGGRGVLLPQVATNQGWDRETFLDQVCVKAGLPTAAWKNGSASVSVFTAEVFSED